MLKCPKIFYVKHAIRDAVFWWTNLIHVHSWGILLLLWWWVPSLMLQNLKMSAGFTIVTSTGLQVWTRPEVELAGARESTVSSACHDVSQSFTHSHVYNFLMTRIHTCTTFWWPAFTHVQLLDSLSHITQLPDPLQSHLCLNLWLDLQNKRKQKNYISCTCACNVMLWSYVQGCWWPKVFSPEEEWHPVTGVRGLPPWKCF